MGDWLVMEVSLSLRGGQPLEMAREGMDLVFNSRWEFTFSHPTIDPGIIRMAIRQWLRVIEPDGENVLRTLAFHHATGYDPISLLDTIIRDTCGMHTDDMCVYDIRQAILLDMLCDMVADLVARAGDNDCKKAWHNHGTMFIEASVRED